MTRVLAFSTSTERSVPCETPLPFNCPTCGERLSVYGCRVESDDGGLPKVVDVYMCNMHGFHTFRTGKAFSKDSEPWGDDGPG